MLRKMIPAILSALLLVWVAGCSESPNKSNPQVEEPNLEDLFGGYLATSEAPGFGDSDLLSEAAADEDFDDTMLGSLTADSVISDPEAGHYHLRAVWGRLQYDSSVTEVTDWTGSLTVSRGALIIRRAIRFELGQDYIPTRESREVVEWVSYTTVHNDGVAIDIFVPSSDSEIVEPVTVSFETGPYSRVFTIDELTALDTVVMLDDSNAVAFHALRLDRVPCARGFLSGRWGYNDEGEGVFRGLWMSKNGRISGYLRGHFGVNSTGEKVFFGKWVSRSGQFEGFIRGVWDTHPNVHANGNAFRHAGGWFGGHIFSANGDEIGELKGKYKSHPNHKKGFLQGRWRLNCNGSEGELDPSDTEEGF